MIVISACIKMRCYKHLIICASHLLCKFNAKPMALFRCYFACLKTLICVVGNIAGCLTKMNLNIFHFFIGCIGIAIYACDKARFFTDCFLSVLGIVNCIFQIRINCFVWISGIINNTRQTVFDCPNFCYSHYPSSPITRFEQKFFYFIKPAVIHLTN